MATLLLVDDEPNVLYSVGKSLQSETLTVLTAATGKQGIEQVQEHRPDAVILDVRLTDMSGLEAFDRIRAIDARVPVIVITAYAATEVAIEAMKRGAFEYLLKPVDLHKLKDVVARAVGLSRARRVPAVFTEPVGNENEVDLIVGQTPAMQEIYKAIGRAAPQDMTVLILGENGTGKELVARAIYQHSRRAQAPFLPINCAAIPEALLESELFGHEKGAYTGADRKRIGKFEQCSGGTLFLDEIGDMSLLTQAKMLRLLQDQRFERLGGGETIQTDVRLIAATNQDLEALVAVGKFRRDLFYRLNVFAIRLPALRERLDDLPVLVEHFIQRFNRCLGKQVSEVSLETMQLLRSHGWPGNVRELQSAIKYALVQAAGDVLTPDALPENLRPARSRPAPAEQPLTGPAASELALLVGDLVERNEPRLYRKLSLQVDRVILETVLRHVHGNQVQASEVLGISRTTLRAKLRALGMALEKQLLPEPGPAEQKMVSA